MRMSSTKPAMIFDGDKSSNLNGATDLPKQHDEFQPFENSRNLYRKADDS